MHYEGISERDHILKIVEKIHHIQNGYYCNYNTKQMSDLIDSMRENPIIYHMDLYDGENTIRRKFRTEIKEEYIKIFTIQTAIGVILPFSNFLLLENYETPILIDDTTYSDISLLYYTRKVDFSNAYSFLARILCLAFYYEIYSITHYKLLYHIAFLHVIMLLTFMYLNRYNVYFNANTRFKKFIYIPLVLLGIRVRRCCDYTILILLALNVYYILNNSILK